MTAGVLSFVLGILMFLVGMGMVFLYKERKDIICLTDGLLCFLLCLLLIAKGLSNIITFGM